MNIRTKITTSDWTTDKAGSQIQTSNMSVWTDLNSFGALSQDIWTAYDEAVAAMRAEVLQQEQAAAAIQSAYQPPDHLPLIWQINTNLMPEKTTAASSPEVQAVSNSPVMSDEEIAALRALIVAQEPPSSVPPKGQECPDIEFFLGPVKTAEPISDLSQIAPLPVEEPAPFCGFSPKTLQPFEGCEYYPLPQVNQPSGWEYIVFGL